MLCVGYGIYTRERKYGKLYHAEYGPFLATDWAGRGLIYYFIWFGWFLSYLFLIAPRLVLS